MDSHSAYAAGQRDGYFNDYLASASPEMDLAAYMNGFKDGWYWMPRARLLEYLREIV